MIDPEKLDAFLALLLDGGALVCSPADYDWLVAELRPDVRARVVVIRHPWCVPGEMWAVGRGAWIAAPPGTVAG